MQKGISRKNLYTMAFCAFFLNSCENRKGQVAKQRIEDFLSKKQVKEPNLELSPIIGFPEAIDGCACYFSQNDQDFEKDKFIYLNDFASLSYLNINGELVEFSLIPSNDSNSTPKFHLYRSKDFELRVNIEKKTDLDQELAKLEGKLLLKDLKTGHTKSFSYVGECGC